MEALRAFADKGKGAGWTRFFGEGDDSTKPSFPCECPLVKETSPFKERWDLLIVLFILYSAVIVPLRICFQAEAEGYIWAFEASVSLFFLADLILSFNTAYLKDGEWVTSREAIARRYLQGWFWIDAPASLPVELIELALPSEDAGGSALPAFRILRMLRLVRMLRLLKISQYIGRLEENFEINLRPLRVVELVIQMVFIAHMLACAWFLTTWIDGVDELKWIDYYDDGSAAEGPVARQYYFSFWWAMTTLFAINPIPPRTDGERNFMIVVCLLNRLFLAYIVGKIASLITQLDRQAAMVRDKLDVVKEYLQWRRTPKELAIRVKRYYEFYYQRQAVYDERSILACLSPSLKTELVRSNSRHTLGRLPLFSKLSTEFLSQIFPLAKPLSFNKGDVIFRAGSASTDLLFLLEGDVEMMSCFDGVTPNLRIQTDAETILAPPPEETGRDTNRMSLADVGVIQASNKPAGAELVRMPGHGCFGQEVLVGMRRRCNARARTQVETLIIEKKDLLGLLKQSELLVDLRRICAVVLDAFLGRERLRNFRTKMRRAQADAAGDVEQHAALSMLLAWRRFRDEGAQRNDELYKLITEKMDRRASINLSRGGTVGRHGALYVGGRRSSGVKPPAAPAALPAPNGAAAASAASIERLVEHLERLERKHDQLQADVTKALGASKA